MGEPPLNLRFRQIMLNYYSHLQGHMEDHPAVVALRQCCESGRAKKECYAWTVSSLAVELGIYRTNFCPTVPFPVTPIWLLPPVIIDTFINEEMGRRKGKGNWAEIVEKRFRMNHLLQYIQMDQRNLRREVLDLFLLYRV